MAIWEYKVISSGKGGFATPQLLENFLNQLGKDEWEIIDYRPGTDNALAFTGLASRGTQRDWTLEAATAAQAKIDEERRRTEEQTMRDEAVVKHGSMRDERLRTLCDTERDDDPEALAEEAAAADDLTDWEDIDLDDDLPNLFDALKPHLRRNQRGPGGAVAIDYLARRWDQEPADMVGALIECGFSVPKSGDDAPDYFEFEGDLFWLNCNNRGQLCINVREKPRPRFKPATMRKLVADDPASEELRAEFEGEQEKKRAAQTEREAREVERAARRAAVEAEANNPGDPLPEGLEMLEVLKPKMRRNRRGPGMSGTISFLAKALRHKDEVLLEALATIGLTLEEGEDGNPAFLEVGDELFWLQKGNRGGVWINCRDQDREKRRRQREERDDTGESKDAVKSEDSAEKSDSDVDAKTEAEAPVPVAEPAVKEVTAPVAVPSEVQADPAPIQFVRGPKALPALRLLLKPKTRGTGASAEIGALARKLDRAAVEILEVLVKAGLSVPDDAKEKPTFVELGEEILWINRNAKDESLWLNAKAKPKRTRLRATKKTTSKKTSTRVKKATEGEESAPPVAIEKPDSDSDES
ncbi:MAG: hypothetical protein J6386_16410 [Candidatus Synoicihabitans palmerolidicus]|nr:hypothetical protein [Candidatus Synoicihabitans palmerolidicus]